MKNKKRVNPEPDEFYFTHPVSEGVISECTMNRIESDLDRLKLFDNEFKMQLERVTLGLNWVEVDLAEDYLNVSVVDYLTFIINGEKHKFVKLPKEIRNDD